METAEHFECNWTAVERNIRTAVSRAWSVNPDLLCQMAGYPLESEPTSSQFIEIISSYIIRSPAAGRLFYLSPFLFPFSVDVLPDADLDAAADGIHLPGIKRPQILSALALVNRRDLLQEDDAPISQERCWRHRILRHLAAMLPRPGRDRRDDQRGRVEISDVVLQNDDRTADAPPNPARPEALP